VSVLQLFYAVGAQILDIVEIVLNWVRYLLHIVLYTDFIKDEVDSQILSHICA